MEYTASATPRTDNFPCGDIMPLGITGTPAIDAGNIYVVAEIEDSPTHFEFDLVTLTLRRRDHAADQHRPRQP